MDVFKDALNIMEKRSITTKCNGKHNGGTPARTVTPLRNPRNRDNAGNSECLHFPTTYMHRWEMYKKSRVGTQKILSLFVDAVQDPADNRETGKAKLGFTKVLLGKDPG